MNWVVAWNLLVGALEDKMTAKGRGGDDGWYGGTNTNKVRFTHIKSTANSSKTTAVFKMNLVTPSPFKLALDIESDWFCRKMLEARNEFQTEDLPQT